MRRARRDATTSSQSLSPIATKATESPHQALVKATYSVTRPLSQPEDGSFWSAVKSLVLEDEKAVDMRKHRNVQLMNHRYALLGFILAILVIILFFAWKPASPTNESRYTRNSAVSQGGFEYKNAELSKLEAIKKRFFRRRVPQALQHLSDMSTPYDSNTEVPLFWDIHFSGETMAERVFRKCHSLIQACEHGLEQPNFNDEELQVFETPDGSLYVNVDTTTTSGIRRAEKLELAQKRIAELMISPRLHEFADSIFDETNKGRLFALFRHPVDRAVSMYYYLATASWDPMFDPKIKEMTLVEYAKSGSVEHNWVTRFLVNKPGGRLNENDMLTAKAILRKKCLVGLFEQIDDSLARFAKYFGWAGSDKTNSTTCRQTVLENWDRRHDHPPVEEHSIEWEALVAVNRYDLELYEYAKLLYQQQGEQIFGVV